MPTADPESNGTHCAQCGGAIDAEETAHFCGSCRVVLHLRCRDAHCRDRPHPETGTPCAHCGGVMRAGEPVHVCPFCFGFATMHASCKAAHNRAKDHPEIGKSCSQCGVAFKPEETVHVCRHCRVTMHVACMNSHYSEPYHPPPVDAW